MDNVTIAEQFSLLSRLMTVHEENPFKIRSYANAARQIEKLTWDLSTMTEKEIGQIPGVGQAIRQKIMTLLQTNELPLLEKYKEKTPAGIQDMLQIKGIGIKKLVIIWKEMGIESAGELLYACDEGRLTRYKGFGEKTQENIGKSIAYYLQSKGSYLYAEAREYSKQIQHFWKKHIGDEVVFIPSGDLRRQVNTLTTIEFVTNASTEILKNNLPENFKITGSEGDKITLEKEAHPKVVLYHSTKEKMGTRLFKTTGNNDFMASINNLHPEITDEAFSTEEELFEAINTPFIIPPLREHPPAQIPSTKNIIQLGDIKGIIHTHSTWSDGKNSIEDMALTAQSLGMEYLVVSDHSKSAGYAKGLSAERVLNQQKEIDLLNKRLAPFKIFKSIESDILSDGSLDYEEDILDSFDLIIASIHSNLKMDKEKATQRLLKAISNPRTTILGHPTGRLLLSREGYPIDHNLIIKACVENNVAIEINAHPRRLDLDWRFIPQALQQGAVLSINPDAHSTKGIKAIKYGIWSAQKGGLPPSKNLSSFSLAEFEGYLASLKKSRNS